MNAPIHAPILGRASAAAHPFSAVPVAGAAGAESADGAAGAVGPMAPLYPLA